MSNSEVIYKNYWRRKELADSSPRFPVVSYWLGDKLNPTEEIILNEIKNKSTLLDFGAGDLRIKNKFINHGFSGSYRSLDHSDEHPHDYKELQDVSDQFDAILLLDVIEHMPLNEGLELLTELLNKLNDEGCLVLQTPNGRCIRNQKATDMTHLHIYNLKDLWSYVVAMGFQAKGYRVAFADPSKSLVRKVLNFFSKFVTTRLLGCDYADNILLIIHK